MTSSGIGTARTALAAVVFLLAAPATADWQDGGQLAERCRATAATDAPSLAFCLGYIQGALDAYLLGRASCVPTDVDAGGLREVVLDYLDAHPDRLAKPGPALIYDAFRTAWPACERMPKIGG